ncbi:ribosomal L18 C-terminal region-domain-containing protein [Phakopsora pachyrhizi]|uniref:Ribosomal L18 C-terminal region-domain-containing protein n=1 Tax=Phakopsora pachyrhizi TaxID=170000 RepID=A0AAV0B6W2_PHAPC|nr:ribosomal L18 C-terminal region-domain-containing protein [Phakopsora pachyrhizi]
MPLVKVVKNLAYLSIVLASAYSHELPCYGIKHGLTNWTAAYATGLLVARRALIKLGLADKYEGVEEPEGDLVLTEANEEGPCPFKAFIDVGLWTTSTGACAKELDSKVLKNYIYCGHVAEYMESLEEEDEEQFKKRFSTYLADDIGSGDIEEIYTEAHKAILVNPSPKPTDKSKLRDYKAGSKKAKLTKIGKEQCAAKVKAKVEACQAAQS